MDVGLNKDAAPTDARLARRDAVLAAVARAAARLSEPQPWESLVPDALRILGEATGVSRVYIFEVERVDGIEVVSQRFEWCAAGVPPQIDNPELQHVPLEAAGFTRWAEFMKKGEPVFGDVGDFPESERPLLEMQEIKSLLVQPIFEGTRWWGFMGFDACASVQSWERVEVDTLRIAALVLGSAINRQSRDALLRETQKLEALGRMAGSVSHDFNNVLMVIAGAMELLRGELEDAGQHVLARGQHVTMVDQALERASALTRRLLDFSRRRAGTPQVLSPLELLRRDEPLLKQAIGSKVRLRIIHGGDGRAIAPVRRGVETLPAGDYVMVEVADTGIGIPPENLGRIFEPFFSTKEVGSGTGLGLSTVYGIVKQTGGFVLVDSRPGAGAVFRILLPRWQGEAPPPREAAVEARRLDTTGAGTVLLVEDEDAVRLFSSRALRNKGYTVLEAKSGENALEILAAEPAIDLLITDVVMPQMDGTELIRQVRLARPAMRVVCISGYAEEAFRKRLDSEPGVQFLPKPFTLEQLAGAVKDALP